MAPAGSSVLSFVAAATARHDKRFHCPWDFCTRPSWQLCGGHIWKLITTIHTIHTIHTYNTYYTYIGPLAYRAVAVVDGDGELLEVPARVRLRQAAVAHHQLEHVTPGGILHGNGQEVLCEEHLHAGYGMTDKSWGQCKWPGC